MLGSMGGVGHKDDIQQSYWLGSNRGYIVWKRGKSGFGLVWAAANSFMEVLEGFHIFG